MIIHVLKRLEKSGDLKRLVRARLISTKVFTYRDIYYTYDKNIKLGKSRMEALHDTAIEMRVSETTVWLARKAMTA